jgi:bifunctional DNase/RNase
MKRNRRRAKRRKTSLYLILLLVIVIVALGALIFYLLFKDILLPAIVSIPQLSTEGYTEVMIGLNVTEDMGIVSLLGNCYELTMVISRDQAISLEDGINRIIGPRPSTHDLVKDMLKNLGARILMIKIVELRNGTYYARLLLRKDNLILSLDSRPSDALAIASRVEYGVSIYVEDSMLENFGERIC